MVCASQTSVAPSGLRNACNASFCGSVGVSDPVSILWPPRKGIIALLWRAGVTPDGKATAFGAL